MAEAHDVHGDEHRVGHVPRQLLSEGGEFLDPARLGEISETGEGGQGVEDEAKETSPVEPRGDVVGVRDEGGVDGDIAVFDGVARVAGESEERDCEGRREAGVDDAERQSLADASLVLCKGFRHLEIINYIIPS